MEKIKNNLETFFTTWGIILVLNQVVVFGGCFAPYCILAALPHTGFIAFISTNSNQITSTGIEFALSRG